MFSATDEFVPPPECPVFEPTWDEFKDPMSYIERIRSTGERSGICKIHPPPEWQPPFVIDMDSFKFIPRIQKLNELEAQSRVKIIFLNNLSKFWELQGLQLKIPMVDRKYLDLYKLQKLVREEGGFATVCNERKWTRVATRMKYPVGKGFSSTLRNHYERIIYPYDIFLSGATLDSAEKFVEVKEECDDAVKNKDEEVKIYDDGKETKSVEPRKIEPLYETRKAVKERYSSLKSNLAAVVFSKSDVLTGSLAKQERVSNNKEEKKKKSTSDADQYFCEVCSRGDRERLLLLCDGCDDAFHTFCLLPPLDDVPRGDWRCPKCVAKECHKPVEAYGFEQAEREYTLESFGAMADKFKMNHFKKAAHMVPTETVEKEFWRLVTSLDEDVVVEYGADIHAAEYGSGFPTEKNQDVIEDGVKMYVENGWNLNNLPSMPSSVLQYISDDISGMKVPWCYVGMCFASFSWHTEDHWSYSVNYMHWGEPKTWYGVPGAKAELLEECMKKIAPELFEQSPDLLHQLTTILNPNVLMAYGVPVTRTDQHAGEFVITFPRAYHGGFNQGFNFAEAVNFCPVDWVPYGRASIDHYKELHRQCVFSNDELMCKMATSAETLDINLARMVYDDLKPVFEDDERLRKNLSERGLVRTERETFELLQDDERQCSYCKTTCFLSSVTCSCTPNRMVCLNHIDRLCCCDYRQRCLRYKFVPIEMSLMLLRLKERAETKERWQRRVDQIMRQSGGLKPDFLELKNFIQEANRERIPDNEHLRRLTSAVADADRCIVAINQLTGSKVRTRQRGNGSNKYATRPKVEELKQLCLSAEDLSCRICEIASLKDLLQSIEEFEKDCSDLLQSVDLPNISDIEKIINRSADFNVELDATIKLHEMLAQSKWLKEVSLALEDTGSLSIEDMHRLIESGINLAPHASCEKAVDELQKFLTLCQDLEDSASSFLKSWKDTGCKLKRKMVEELIAKANDVDACLPCVDLLIDYVRKADDWISRAGNVMNAPHQPHLEDLEALRNKAQQIPISMIAYDQLEFKLAAVKSWLQRVKDSFKHRKAVYSVIGLMSKQYLSDKKTALVQIDKSKKSCNMTDQYQTMELCCRRELEKIRLQNKEKILQPLETNALCCSVCSKMITKFKRRCPVCQDCFHAKCLSKGYNGKKQTSIISCPSCSQTGRPKMETIKSLINSYKELHVCLPVAEVLSLLLGRMVTWKQKAAEALNCDEILLARKMLERGQEEDMPLQHQVVSCVSSSSTCGISFTDATDVSLTEEVETSPLMTIMNSEHAYSVSTPQNSSDNITMADGLNKKPNRCTSSLPLITLSETIKSQLSDLVIEFEINDVEMNEMVDIACLLYAVQCKSRKRKRIINKSSVETVTKKMKLEGAVKNGEDNSCSKMPKFSSISIPPSDSAPAMKKKQPAKGQKGQDLMKKSSKRNYGSRKKEEKNEQQDFSSSDSDDEMCSASTGCQKPKAKKVNWVQCDRCLLWFHLFCIGQTLNDVSEESEYVCNVCLNVSAPPTSSLNSMPEIEDLKSAVKELTWLSDDFVFNSCPLTVTEEVAIEQQQQRVLLPLAMDLQTRIPCYANL